jgi:O-antigen/teichoic acid export membrane protein
MSTVQRVARNTGIVTVGDIIFRIISLFVIIYLARYLGTEGFGKYNFVFAYLAFFGVIPDLGLYTILVREMSRDESIAPKVIGNLYIIKLILTIFAVVLSIVVISFLPYPADTTAYVYTAAFTMFFLSFTDIYVAIFQANLRMEYSVIAKLAFKFISAGLILWVIFSHGTLMQVIIILVISEMVKTLISYLFARKFVRPRFEIDFGLWKYLLREALPIALSSVIWTIYHRIDVVMLSMMAGDASVGIYSAAYKLSEPLLLIPSALMMSIFPIMSASFKKSEERLIKSYKLSTKYLLIITLPLAIGTTLIADKIVFLVYGAEFAGSATALQLLIWSLVFTSVNSVLLNLLVSIYKQKLSTVSMIICAVVNVILNFVLIPILSYNGAAIATVVTNIVWLIASFYFVSKHFQMIPLHKILVKPVISGLVMAVFIYYFTGVNIFLLISSAGIVYLVALLALKTFSDEDWEIVKRIISNVPWIRSRF